MNYKKHTEETVHFFANRFKLMAMDIIDEQLNIDMFKLPQAVLNAMQLTVAMEMIQEYKKIHNDNSLLNAIEQKLNNEIILLQCTQQNN